MTANSPPVAKSRGSSIAPRCRGLEVNYLDQHAVTSGRRDLLIGDRAAAISDNSDVIAGKPSVKVDLERVPVRVTVQHCLDSAVSNEVAGEQVGQRGVEEDIHRRPVPPRLHLSVDEVKQIRGAGPPTKSPDDSMSRRVHFVRILSSCNRLVRVGILNFLGHSPGNWTFLGRGCDGPKSGEAEPRDAAIEHPRPSSAGAERVAVGQGKAGSVLRVSG